jgi:hypothetical protein
VYNALAIFYGKRCGPRRFREDCKNVTEDQVEQRMSADRVDHESLRGSE